MENTVPEPPSTPSLQSKGLGYRFALLLTGSAAAAEAVLRQALAECSEALGQLRSRARRRALLIRQIRAVAAKWREENPAEPDTEGVQGRIAALPERDRCALALFLCLEPETPVEAMAELLHLKLPLFIKAIASARQALAPAAVFPEKPLLREHRPWGGDRPKVAKAVAAAGESPELAAQAEADALLYADVGFLEVPAPILELVPAAPERPRLRVLLFQPAVLAIVLATLVVLGTVIYIVQARSADFPGRETAEEIVEHSGTEVEYEPFTATQAGDLDDWFVLKGFAGFGVPSDLDKARAVGGRLFRYNGLPIAEVELSASNARLLVFHLADLKKTTFNPGTSWRFFQEDDWAVGVTRDDDNGYILLFEGDSATMPRFFEAIRKAKPVE
ncbi:MAG: hypothetical protein ACFUZC_02130 [Chthoniobacteraceae bacterium]